jgi:hypothetical protein
LVYLDQVGEEVGEEVVGEVGGEEVVVAPLTLGLALRLDLLGFHPFFQ